MHQHALAFRHYAVIDPLVPEGNGPHFADEGGIKTDLLHASHNRGGGGRNLRPFGRREVNQHDVGSFALEDQRKDRGISCIAAIPIIFAVDFDRLHQQRQACRSEYVVGGKFVAGEDLHLGRAHVGCAKKQLDRLLLANPVEVDELLQ